MINKIHLLKCVQPHFDDLKSGEKTYELRKNDRDYQVGDILVLTLFDPETYQYDNCQQILTEITQMLDDQTYLQPGYVALGIKPPIHITKSGISFKIPTIMR